MQNQEFSDGTGLEEHDFGARFYDQQLGRWHNPDPGHQFANPYLAMANNWPNGVDPNGMNFWGTLADIGLIGGAAVAGILTGGIGYYLIAAGGYAGASIESGGHWNPHQWNSKAWEGALSGELLTASALVGIDEIADPGDLTAGFGSTGASIAKGVAQGVAQQVGSTIAGNYAAKKPLITWDQLTKSTVSGALLGAWQGANPGADYDDDGNLLPTKGSLVGLRDITSVNESPSTILLRRSLFNLGNVLGSSVANNWIKGKKLFSSFNLPVGPTPFVLTFGKGQTLFQWQNNLMGIVATGVAGNDVLNDFSDYGPSYNFSIGELQPGFNNISFLDVWPKFNFVDATILKILGSYEKNLK